MERNLSNGKQIDRQKNSILREMKNTSTTKKLISNYDIEKHETYIDFLKENLNDKYFLFTDSRTRQIDLYLIYKDI